MSTEYHDAETLEMARTICSPSVTKVQMALERFWAFCGQPTERLREDLRVRITEAVTEEVKAFFGRTIEEGE